MNTCASSYEKHSGIEPAKRAQCSPNLNSDPTPSVCAEERSFKWIRARDCLSAASASGTPLEAPQVARSEAQGRRQQGRLFLAYLILAKQKKVSRPPRRQSGTGTWQRSQRLIHAKGFDKLSKDETD